MSPTTLSLQFYSKDSRIHTTTSHTTKRQHQATTARDEHIMQQAAIQERSRLSRELHDSVTQSLYSLTLLAEGWRRMANDGVDLNTAEVLTELGNLGKQALKEARLLVYELRSPLLEEEGLVGAIQKRLSAVEKRAGIDAKLLVSDREIDLHPDQEEELYWFAHEALANSLKHSGADEIQIRLTTAQGTDIIETETLAAKPASAERESPGRVFEALAQPMLQLPVLAGSREVPRHGGSQESAYQAADSHSYTHRIAGHREYDMPMVKARRGFNYEGKRRASSSSQAMETPVQLKHESSLGRKEPSRVGKSIILEIEDNGCGFESTMPEERLPEERLLDQTMPDTEDARNRLSDWGGMGLRSMQERADKLNGTFTIHSARGIGTRIQLIVPVIEQ